MKFAKVMFFTGVCLSTRGAVPGCLGGACLVAARRGVLGCSQEGACIVVQGACMVASGGMHGCSGGGGVHGCCWGGHAWDMMRYGDTINEQAVRYASYWNAFLFQE